MKKTRYEWTLSDYNNALVVLATALQLSATQLLLMMTLGLIANNSGWPDAVKAPKSRLTAMSRMSENTLYRVRQTLAEEGLVEIEDGTGRGKDAATYILPTRSRMKDLYKIHNIPYDWQDDPYHIGRNRPHKTQTDDTTDTYNNNVVAFPVQTTQTQQQPTQPDTAAWMDGAAATAGPTEPYIPPHMQYV